MEAGAYLYVAEELKKKFPNLQRIAITLRGSISASHNTWSGVLYDGQRLYTGAQYDIIPIVDRVGGGDSFAGGLIYSLLQNPDDLQRALDFAIAASCLKHSIWYDFNCVSVAEVEGLLKTGGACSAENPFKAPGHCAPPWPGAVTGSPNRSKSPVVAPIRVIRNARAINGPSFRRSRSCSRSTRSPSASTSTSRPGRLRAPSSQVKPLCLHDPVASTPCGHAVTHRRAFDILVSSP